MDLRNEFSVPADPDEVFVTLLDLERVAACMPGATMTGQVGEQYEGFLKLRLGPISAAYEGNVVFESVDKSARSARLRASATESQGQGTASAAVAAEVIPAEGGSRVRVETTLDIQGKAAQFGRGVLADVSTRLIDQFAANLESMLVEDQPGQAPAGTAGEQTHAESEATAQPAISSSDAGEVDIMSVFVLPWLRQAGPWIAAGTVGLLVGWLLGGRRRRWQSVERLLSEQARTGRYR